MSRSVLEPEIYALADAFDFAYTNRENLEAIYMEHMHLNLIKGSTFMFYVTTSCTITEKKRLMIDIKSV